MPIALRRALRWLAISIWLLLVFVGGSLTFLVVDHSVGRTLAWVAVVVFVAVPVGLGVLVESVAERRGREVHAEKVAAGLAPVWSLGLVAILVLVVRGPTGDALASFPEPLRRLGRTLSPRKPAAHEPAGFEVEVTTKTKTSTTTSSPSTTTAPPPPSSSTVGPDRFASGDPTYTEEIPGCTALSPVEPLVKAYAPGALRPAAEGLARLRYPTGLPFLAVQDDKVLKAWFLHAPDTFAGVASRFDAAVHEGAHVWGSKRFDGVSQTYPVRDDLPIKAKLQKNFHWKEILGQHVDRPSDTYARIYLDGPSGAQGFNVLLDEYNAYAHSLASRYCTRDLLPDGARVSARDGVLTMMYYLETYLAIGRTTHPVDYAAILADPGTRKVILTVWDRAEFWLRKSAALPALGIQAETIEGWVYAKERLAEIARVRAVK